MSVSDIGADRRAFLMLALGAPLLLSLATPAAAAPDACVDVDALPRSERNLRRTNNFQMQSDDPKKVCAGCAFFTPNAAVPGCGQCAIFNGGGVTAASRCDRWTKR
jgi:hypothetical protein